MRSRMEVKLKKEDEDFIKSLEDSSFSDDSKKRLIDMIKANRVMMDMILDELDLTKHNSDYEATPKVCPHCNPNAKCTMSHNCQAKSCCPICKGKPIS